MRRSIQKAIGWGAIGLGVLSLLAFTHSSKAGLQVCNKSNRGPVRLIVAYPNQGTWTTQGWLSLNPDQCDMAIEGTLSNRYYYYFAVTNDDYTWRGTHPFCIADRSFTFIHANKQCEGGYSRWETFRELDTGKDAVNYTLDLR